MACGRRCGRSDRTTPSSMHVLADVDLDAGAVDVGRAIEAQERARRGDLRQPADPAERHAGGHRGLALVGERPPTISVLIGPGASTFTAIPYGPSPRGPPRGMVNPTSTTRWDGRGRRPDRSVRPGAGTRSSTPMSRAP